MSRDDGFRNADVSTAMLSDPKFKGLWRLQPESAAMAEGIVLYLAVLLASWEAGTRVAAIDAAPYWLALVAEHVTVLQQVGLLDGEQCIPDHAWKSWYGPAAERRAVQQDRWRRANRKRLERARQCGVIDDAPMTPRRDTQATGPPVPPDPSVPPARSEGSKTGSGYDVEGVDADVV